MMFNDAECFKPSAQLTNCASEENNLWSEVNDSLKIMPSYTDTCNDYVQWQSARRQARLEANDAAIDIIEHYNTTHRETQDTAFSLHTNTILNSLMEERSPRVDMFGTKLTHRTLSKKSQGRHGGVFTEGISSLSKRSQFALSLKRSDIVSENLPDNIKVSKADSKIYLTLSQPQGNDSHKTIKKGDTTAKSISTCSSFPWNEMASVTEMGRAKTFTLDDRATLSTRSTLDSRQAISDVHPPTERRAINKQINHFSMYYPNITGAPPNTPLNMPSINTVKVPSVSIVSLGGESAESTMKRLESHPRFHFPTRGVSNDRGLARGKGHMASVTASKPGIDLPHLPLRYSEAKDASFQFTPRERPSRMNYKKGRRHMIFGHLKQHNKSETSALVNSKSENNNNDPYAERFRQASSVMSFGDVCLPVVPSVAGRQTEITNVSVLEPAVMLTVQEEDNENGDACLQVRVNLNPPEESSILSEKEKDKHLPGAPDETVQLLSSERLKKRSQSNVSVTSLLSVPMNIKDLSDARPPPLYSNKTDPGVLQTETGQEPVDKTEPGPADSPPIASTSVIDTARTVATQTSFPLDSPEVEKRPTLVKVKTLSMFPDISCRVDDAEDNGITDCTTEPLLRMSHGESLLDYKSLQVMGLPELQRKINRNKDLTEEDLKGKTNGVQNITFISPLNVQHKAKRF